MLFDGHGGSQCAQYLADHLPTLIVSALPTVRCFHSLPATGTTLPTFHCPSCTPLSRPCNVPNPRVTYRPGAANIRQTGLLRAAARGSGPRTGRAPVSAAQFIWRLEGWIGTSASRRGARNITPARLYYLPWSAAAM
ncbi:hypothetical protein T492DRAFT_1013022, partial [Pavlovales sp. CCMP2436]